ncbi:MAG TPA: anti-sigma factor [Solirubrobacteraceae bacterium]|nr:anti-sigma factor [Solirubrobacteraceae bacterium]
METSGDIRDCGADVAAYVLGALDHDEASAFREHLQTCAICRDEVSALGAVVDALPLAAPPHTPPRTLKRSLMATVRAEARGAESARPAQPGRWSFVPRPAFGLAAAAMAAAAVLVGVAIGGSGSATRLVHASTGWPATQASLRITGSHAELVVAKMPAPPAGKVYEVWLGHANGAPTPTNALFSVTSRGAAQVDVPGSLHGVSQVLVTPEPAGGSRVPTHAPVVVANL